MPVVCSVYAVNGMHIEIRKDIIKEVNEMCTQEIISSYIWYFFCLDFRKLQPKPNTEPNYYSQVQQCNQSHFFVGRLFDYTYYYVGIDHRNLLTNRLFDLDAKKGEKKWQDIFRATWSSHHSWCFIDELEPNNKTDHSFTHPWHLRRVFPHQKCQLLAFIKSTWW